MNPTGSPARFASLVLLVVVIGGALAACSQAKTQTTTEQYARAAQLKWLNQTAEPINRDLNKDQTGINGALGSALILMDFDGMDSDLAVARKKLAALADVKAGLSASAPIVVAWRAMIDATATYADACNSEETHTNLSNVARCNKATVAMTHSITHWNDEVSALRKTRNTEPTLPTLPPATTSPTTTTTMIAPSPPSPPTTAVAAGYFNKAQVEGYLSSVAESRQGGALNWSGGQATTDDGVCTFTLTNSEGESSSLVDSIAVSCGPPSTSSSLSQSDAQESEAFLFGIVQDVAGSAASSWLTQETADASSGVVANKEFGPVSVGINYGDGQLGETLLWQGD